MKLIDITETQEKIYTNTEDENKPVFTLRKLTAGEVESINDSTSGLDEKNRLMYLGGTSIRLKIKYALVSWKNIVDSSGKEVSCNDVNKEKLPPAVALWLSREIDELSGLLGISEDVKKN